MPLARPVGESNELPEQDLIYWRLIEEEGLFFYYDVIGVMMLQTYYILSIIDINVNNNTTTYLLN